MSRITAILIVVMLTVPMNVEQVLAQGRPKPPADLRSKISEIDRLLDQLAQETARELRNDQFRKLLHSETMNSKNREQILEYTKFIDKVASQLREQSVLELQTSVRNTSQKMKDSGILQFEGIDLYFPVDEHRENWKGDENFFVAAVSLLDERDVPEVIAYSVKTGDRIPLDPMIPPDVMLLVVAPEEHETHDQITAAGESLGIQPIPDFIGPEPPELKTKEGDGHSHVGLNKVLIHETFEGCCRGDPEIRLLFGIWKDESCQYDDHRGLWCAAINKTWLWYPTWHPIWSYRGVSYYACQNPSGSSFRSTKWFFDGSFSNKMFIFLYEQDGGDVWSWPIGELDEDDAEKKRWSKMCRVKKGLYDDWIDYAYQFRSNIPYGGTTRQYLPDSWLEWKKTTN